MDSETKDFIRGTGAAAVAGGALAATPTVANRSKGVLVRRQMTRKVGTLGGLDTEGKPVNPFELSGKRGGKDDAGRRTPSARARAAGRYREAASSYERRLAKPAIGGSKAKVMRTAGMVLGTLAGAEATGVALGTKLGEHRQKVRKDDTLTFASPQYGLGIPATRMNPISPLAMSASSRIMADFIVGAKGINLSRKQTKKVRRGAYEFAGAGAQLYSPLGFGRSNG